MLQKNGDDRPDINMVHNLLNDRKTIRDNEILNDNNIIVNINPNTPPRLFSNRKSSYYKYKEFECETS